MTHTIKASEITPRMMVRTAAYLPFVQVMAVTVQRPGTTLAGDILIEYQGTDRYDEPYSAHAYVSPGTIFEVTL